MLNLDYLYEGMDEGTLGQFRRGFGRGRVIVFPQIIRYPFQPYPYPSPYPYPGPAPLPQPQAGTCISVTQNGQSVYRRCFTVAPNDADVDQVCAQIKNL